MGPEHRRFIDSALDQNKTFHDHTANRTRIQKVYDSAWDQNIRRFMTVHGTRTQKVYDSAWDQNTDWL